MVREPRSTKNPSAGAIHLRISFRRPRQRGRTWIASVDRIRLYLVRTAYMPDPQSADAFPAAPACRRSTLSPAVRFAIFFGALFALKLALPYTGLSAALQVLALAAVATVLVWRFWWACGESRRGGVLLLAVLWVAALAKIAVQ